MENLIYTTWELMNKRKKQKKSFKGLERALSFLLNGKNPLSLKKFDGVKLINKNSKEEGAFSAERTERIYFGGDTFLVFSHRSYRGQTETEVYLIQNERRYFGDIN